MDVHRPVGAKPLPFPFMGLEGTLIDVKEGHEEGRPKDQVTMILRVRSSGSSDTCYLHVPRAAFHSAAWEDWGGEHSLVMRFFDFHSVVKENQDTES